MYRLRNDIRKARENLQADLSQSSKEVRDNYKEQQKKLTWRRLELRGKQNKCLRNRLFKHHLGYRCFKPKKSDEENRSTEDNHSQVLDSYF